MKTLTSSILVVVAVIASNVTALWAVVGFILYLVKDDPFNWWSVWWFIIAVIVAITGTLHSSISKAHLLKDWKICKLKPLLSRLLLYMPQYWLLALSVKANKPPNLANIWSFFACSQ